jgi:hypothetical protein
MKNIVELALPEPIKRYLIECGAGNRKHSGRSLLDHLEGTWRLLKFWGCGESTCLGGLFHSIYGTSIFKSNSVSIAHRPSVQQAIGKEAESLAFLFSVASRPQGFLDAWHTGSLKLHAHLESYVRIDKSSLRKLLEIECANLIDQKMGIKFMRSLCVTDFFRGPLSNEDMRLDVQKYVGL